MKEEINIRDLILVTKKAGKEILDVYTKDFIVENKSDHSPITLADNNSHETILAKLKALYPDIPVLSEEGQTIPYSTRKLWDYFWLVDPLDGTKEFIKKNGEFTVNIALIHKNKPVLGVIHAPAKGLFYFAQVNLGAYKLEDTEMLESFSLNEMLKRAQKLPVSQKKDKFTVIVSRTHLTKETEAYIQKIKEKHASLDVLRLGSALKFGMVAEGTVDLYPRFAYSSEWDIAAGQIIVEMAGGRVFNIKTNEFLKYNKESLLNPSFVAKRP
ncbi:MAG: 3'(2'),5'-bisphosphate nucleotidase CysQ [Candidatus Hodarchaeota archaeon]